MLRVLGVKTEVYDFGGQHFIEILRFDHVAQLGRINAFLLRALYVEFVGNSRAHLPCSDDPAAIQLCAEALCLEEIIQVRPYCVERSSIGGHGVIKT